MTKPTGRPRGQPSPIADPVQRARYISLQGQLRQYRKQQRDISSDLADLDPEIDANAPQIAEQYRARLEALRQSIARVQAKSDAIKEGSNGQHQQESN